MTVVLIERLLKMGLCDCLILRKHSAGADRAGSGAGKTMPIAKLP